MGHLHDGILLGCKKEEDFTICDTMDGPGEHYFKWKHQSEKENTIWFHLYVECNGQTELTNKIKTGS